MPIARKNSHLSTSRQSSSEGSSESQAFPLRSLESRHSIDSNPGHTDPLLPTSTPVGSRRRCHPFWQRVVSWVKGPSPPRKYRICPWFGDWQRAPGRLVDCYFHTPQLKLCLLLLVILAWGTAFLSVIHATVADVSIANYGSPSKLSCTAKLWPDGTYCGLNGDYCRPFDEGGFPFRCPAGCGLVILLEPYTVGAEDINYQSLVIGGSIDSNDSDAVGIYRGDSFICAAALHAGIVSDRSGGCGVLRRTGAQVDFKPVKKNGISSIAFASYFPSSFTFDRDSSDEASAKCQDSRWFLFGFSVTVTALLSLFVTTPAAFYTSIFFIVYFQVALSSDPPTSSDYYEVVSVAMGRLLPAAFVGYVVYYFCVRHTLSDLDAHWDKTVLWLGGCWVGALNTDTFDKIPISRLTPHDIKQQPGGIISLIIIVLLLFLIAIGQAYAFRNEGRLPKMLAIYGIIACGIAALLLVPSMNMRIHHYILGLLFLPGTTLQTRPTLLYQGILVGLFINGVARWGFDSILQTPNVLFADARLGSHTPVIAPPQILSNQSISFSFESAAEDAAGISVMVNDVERFHAFKAEDGSIGTFNWTRGYQDALEYFRFAYLNTSLRGGIWYEDFTVPVVWDVDGSWNKSGNS